MRFQLPVINLETGRCSARPMVGYIDLRSEGDGTLVDFKNSARTHSADA